MSMGFWKQKFINQFGINVTSLIGLVIFWDECLSRQSNPHDYRAEKAITLIAILGYSVNIVKSLHGNNPEDAKPEASPQSSLIPR